MIVTEIDHQSEHLAIVKALGAANSQTLGFFPEGAFDDYARRKQILIALDDSQRCVGYLLYRISQERAIIVHLCVDTSRRTTGVGTKLFSQFKDIVNDLRGIGLRCRRDYEANKLWHKLGFVAQFEQPGRGKTRTDLTYWWFDNGHPTLFTDAILEMAKSKTCVVIDANVFFDLNDQARFGYRESNSLRADWLCDVIELCVTDELLNDINRSNDEAERRRDRELAKQFTVFPSDQSRLTHVAEALKTFFPDKPPPRDDSDRWHLARSIAANIQFFVTRDQRLLDLSGAIYESFGITILRPTDLIIRVDELRREVEYAPQRLAGTLSEVRRVQSGQEAALTQRFQAAALGETKRLFQSRLRAVLADPDQHACYVAVDVNKDPIGLFAYSRADPNALELTILRMARGPVANTLVRYILFRSMTQAAQESRHVTNVTDPYRDEIVASALNEDGFCIAGQLMFKIGLPVACTALQLSQYLSTLKTPNGEAKARCEALSKVLGDSAITAKVETANAIEHILWPAKIVDAYIPSFVVPIKPEWAKELFDERLAGQTLFGAKPELGLSREGVYYRAKNPSAGLKAPARVLWYVSYGSRFSGTGHLRACSRLEEVVVDRPKNLFRRFRRLGIYDWEHVFDLAKRDLEKEIMALRFGDTELFENPIEWNSLQEILRRFGCKSQLQSPVQVSPKLFEELYRRGMQIKSQENN
jgi:predicted nucleic acid-binding protein